MFRSLGLDGVKNTLIMRFREEKIRVTLRLIHDITSKSEGTYRYWLTGTGFGFRLNRIGNFLRVFVEVDGHYGPLQGIRYPQSEYVGDAFGRRMGQSVLVAFTIPQQDIQEVEPNNL